MNSKKCGKYVKISVEILSEQNKEIVSNFDCGNEIINNYLRKKALDDFDSVTHLYVNNENGGVVAFATLTCSAIDICSLDGLSFGKRISAVEIKYFATDVQYQHLGYDYPDDINKLSDVVFDDIFEKIRAYSYFEVGASKIILLARPSAVSFYQRHSFKMFDESMLFESNTNKRNYKPMYANLYYEV